MNYGLYLFIYRKQFYYMYELWSIFIHIQKTSQLWTMIYIYPYIENTSIMNYDVYLFSLTSSYLI